MKFIRKPVEVEAVQWWSNDYEDNKEFFDRCGNKIAIACDPGDYYEAIVHGNDYWLMGGDWVILEEGVGVYSCSDEYFQQHFEVQP